MYTILMEGEQYSCLVNQAPKTRVRLARVIKNNYKGRMLLADYLICQYNVAVLL